MPACSMQARAEARTSGDVIEAHDAPRPHLCILRRLSLSSGRGGLGGKGSHRLQQPRALQVLVKATGACGVGRKVSGCGDALLHLLPLARRCRANITAWSSHSSQSKLARAAPAPSWPAATAAPPPSGPQHQERRDSLLARLPSVRAPVRAAGSPGTTMRACVRVCVRACRVASASPQAKLMKN